MPHHKLRKEKNCLNCGTIVEQRFCPKCGQENSINRPSFHYLFSHFAEDFVHYDSGFWKTMKTLTRKPGKIIRDYLDGKRKTYVPPVKLYIFVSFITFFIPFILPDFDNSENESGFISETTNNDFEGIEVAGVNNIKTIQQLDSLQSVLPENKKLTGPEYEIYAQTLKALERDVNPVLSDSADVGNSALGIDVSEDDGRIFKENHKGFNVGKYKNIQSVAQFDSIDKSLAKEDRMGWASKKFFKKLIEFREREVEKGEEVSSIFMEKLSHNLSKVLFIYLPFFAFFLWLFHSKKKWLYYDHGIFTLYYFSFLLVLITFNILVSWMTTSISLLIPSLENIFTLISLFVNLFSGGYAFFYFFRAHSRVYGERKLISRVKSFSLFWINSFFILLILMVYTLFTFMMI